MAASPNPDRSEAALRERAAEINALARSGDVEGYWRELYGEADLTNTRLRVENEALRASLAWAVNWIDYSHEIPLKAEEPSDFEKWTAACGLARASDETEAT